MSTWTHEDHNDAREAAEWPVSPHGIRDLLGEALDEIERLRPALAGAAPETRDEALELVAKRIWTAMAEVAPAEVPQLEDLDEREAKALLAMTDAVVSAVRVMLTRRHAVPPRPAGSEGEVP